MVEFRNASGHLFAGGVTVTVLTVVPSVVQAVLAAVALVLEGQPLGLRGLIRATLLSFVAAVAYTTVVVFPAVCALSRVAGAWGWARWVAPATALLFSAAVDAVLLSRGYWVPDTTLPNWPVWAAAWAFGPAFYIYWSTLRSSQKVVKFADV